MRLYSTLRQDKEHMWYPMSWPARRAYCGRTYYGYGTWQWTHQCIEIKQSNRLYGVLGEGANRHMIKVTVLFSLNTIVYLLYLPTYLCYICCTFYITIFPRFWDLKPHNSQYFQIILVDSLMTAILYSQNM
jgi:hypothetical protein